MHSKRKYGEPKLNKPKELKNIKQLYSVEWIPKKCKCSCFVYNKDLYIQHRDFGSQEVYGYNYEFRQKFIYNDTFGCVVLRGEAWIIYGLRVQKREAKDIIRSLINIKTFYLLESL